eukprot:5606220-Pyramimonas_sp.AAC.1
MRRNGPAPSGLSPVTTSYAKRCQSSSSPASTSSAPSPTSPLPYHSSLRPSKRDFSRQDTLHGSF